MFVIKGIVCDDHKAAHYFNAAVDFLKEHSDMAKFVIGELKRAEEKILIAVVAFEGYTASDFEPPDGDGEYDGGIIKWAALGDPTVEHQDFKKPDVPWLMEEYRSDVMRREVALIHEMGHVMQYLSNSALFDMSRMGRTASEARMSMIENLNVQAIEATVSRELRENGVRTAIRWSYEPDGDGKWNPTWDITPATE